MSRQAWFEKKQFCSADWREAAVHVPLKGRTTDPTALAYDEGAELFAEGVRLARQGDLEAGAALIATAYLLDGRSINWMPILPKEDTEKAADLYLDIKLAYALIGENELSFGSMVLKVMLGQYLGHLPGQEGQEVVAIAMTACDQIVSAIERNPELEETVDGGGVLGGLMTRTNILYQRSSLYMAVGNESKAIQDLTQALKIDPNYAPAREARAILWGSTKSKDSARLHKEFTKLADQAHPDHRGLEGIYAWSAHLTLKDCNLGTVADAKAHYVKMLRASARRAELYGKNQNVPSIIQVVQEQFHLFVNGPEAMRAMRYALDVAKLTGRMDDVNLTHCVPVHVPPSNKDNSRRHKCLKCGKTAWDNGKTLSQCGKCKVAYYCSRTCQQDDWASHKGFCNLTAIRLEGQATAKIPEPSPITTNPKPARERIPELNGSSRAAARMETRLRELYSKLGKGFAYWWHNKAKTEREVLLQEITRNTLPRTRLSLEQIQADLEEGITARVTLDCAIDILIQPCRCAEDDELPSFHHFPDRLLHEMYMRAMQPETIKAYDRKLVSGMMQRGVFPKVFGGDTGTLMIVAPETDDGPAIHDMLPFSVLADESERANVEQWIAEGYVQEANAAVYTMTRKFLWLQLMIKLFDHYEETVRHCPPAQPLERLRGCEHCLQTCEGEDAVCCKTCRVYWWCGDGCQKASKHGRCCPLGTWSESRVNFN